MYIYTEDDARTFAAQAAARDAVCEQERGLRSALQKMKERIDGLAAAVDEMNKRILALEGERKDGTDND